MSFLKESKSVYRCSAKAEGSKVLLTDYNEYNIYYLYKHDDREIRFSQKVNKQVLFVLK